MTGRLAIALTLLVAGLAACGGGDSEEAENQGAVDGDASVLIVLRYDLPDGEVLPESRMGDEPFCPGGTTHDEHGGAGLGLVVTTFDCPDGELVITFSPTQNSLKQSSSWRVVEGTGSFEGLQGGGQMEAEFEEDNPEEGSARFTGTIGP